MAAEPYASYWLKDASILPKWWPRAWCRTHATPRIMAPKNVSELEIAQHVCAQCPVVIECGEYALETKQEYGVWGGLSERERRRILRRRRGVKERNGKR